MGQFARPPFVFFSAFLLAFACGRERPRQTQPPRGTSETTPAVTASGPPSASASATVGAETPERAPQVLPWKGVPKGSVELRVEDTQRAGDIARARVRLAVSTGEGTAPRPLAQATITLAHDGCDALDEHPGLSEPPTVALDLAPYRLDAETVAVGLRFSCSREFPAGSGSATWLHLVRIDGPSLSPVLDVSVERSDLQRGPGDATSEESIVMMAPRAGSFADILVKTTTVHSSIWDTSGNERRRTSTRQFVWDGTRYKLAKQVAPARR
jgi:hypothetical protein